MNEYEQDGLLKMLMMRMMHLIIHLQSLLTHQHLQIVITNYADDGTQRKSENRKTEVVLIDCNLFEYICSVKIFIRAFCL